jgi:hypothetical protein
MRSLASLVVALGVVGLGGSGAIEARALAPGASLAVCELPARTGSQARFALAVLRGEPAPVRGLASRLPQYPDVPAASQRQRVAAERLLAAARRATRTWRNPRAAIAAGFAAERPRRRTGDRTIGIFHAEHRRYSADRRFLDPAHPEVLIYANAPGRPLVLIGVMFSVPRGVLGPTPGGPVTRWHSHLVCARGAQRGLRPRADGSCPPGARLRRGSEMLHLWFTDDVRSAFAVHAPEPELCAARLLSAAHCRSGVTLHTM